MGPASLAPACHKGSSGVAGLVGSIPHAPATEALWFPAAGGSARLSLPAQPGRGTLEAVEWICFSGQRFGK